MILPSCHLPTLHPVLGYGVQSVISRIIINDVPYCILTNYTCTICHYSNFMMTHKLHTPYQHMHTTIYILHTDTSIPQSTYFLLMHAYHIPHTSYWYMHTICVEISVVCNFHGFRGHLQIQRKFNPWKFASLQQSEVVTVHSMCVTIPWNDNVCT